MLTVETTNDSTRLLIDGSTVIYHSHSFPFISVIENSPTKKHSFFSNFFNSPVELDGIQYEENLKILRFFSGNLSISFIVEETSGALSLKLYKSSHDFDKIYIRIPTIPGEAIFGGGGVRTSPNLRGQKIMLWASADLPSDSSASLGGLLNRNAHTFPHTIPFFHTQSLSFAAFFFDGKIELDFTQNNSFVAEFSGIPERITLGHATSEQELLKLSDSFTGSKKPLPAWCYRGIILGISGGSSSLLSSVMKFREAGVPVSALLIRDWTGRRMIGTSETEFWDWTWNREEYPHLDEGISALNRANIRVLCYINPHFAIEGQLFAEASQRGYLIKDSTQGNLLTDMGGFMVGHLDLTNPSACEWMKNIIKHNIFDLGFSGFVADIVSYPPDDCLLFNGKKPAAIRNRWVRLWAELVTEASSSVSSPLIIYTASAPGSHVQLAETNGSAAAWAEGNGLKSALSEMLSLGMSGSGVSFCNFGVYANSIPDDMFLEQYVRWAELSVFTPIMQIQALPTRLAELVADDQKTTNILNRMAALHILISPYIQTCIDNCTMLGIPVLRHPFSVFPEVPQFADLCSTFFLGEELMIAPVLSAAVTEVFVTIPEGSPWVHLLSGVEYQPGEHTIPAPLGSPVVLYKQDGIYSRFFSQLAYRLL